MSVIGKISLMASANPGRFVADCERMADALAGVEKASERVDKTLSQSRTAEGLGGGAGGGGAGGEGADLGGQLAASLGPIGEVVGKIAAMIDRVGGTITTLARRIDASMKFPIAEAGLTRLQEKLETLAPKAAKYVGALRVVLKIKDWFGQLGDVAGRTLSQIHGGFASVTGSANVASKAVGKVSGAFQGGIGFIKSFAVQAAAALGIFSAAYSAVQFFRGAIDGAAHLGESISKLNAILGESGPAAEAFAAGLSKQFGLVKREVIDAESSFAGLGKGLGGLAGKGLSDFSNQFTKLAADLQSYSDMATLAEASQALTISLSGEQSDVLKRLGVIVNENTTKQYAYAHGIAKVGQALSEQEKFTARAAMIMEKLKDAQDDLERTGGGTTNQMRKLAGSLENLQTEFGTAIEPITRSIFRLANVAFVNLGDMIEKNKGAIAAWAKDAAAAGGPVEQGFLLLGKTIGFVADAVKAMTMGFKVFVGVVLGGLAATLKPFGLFNAKINDMAMGLAKSSLEAFEAFDGMLAGGDLSTGINKFFKDVLAGVHGVGAEIEKVAPGLSGFIDSLGGVGAVGGAAASSDANKLGNQQFWKDVDRAKEIIEAAKSPLEQYISKLEEIEDLQSKGFLSEKAAGAAAMKAQKEYGGEARGPRLAGALELGSKEEYSLRVNAGQRKGDDQKNTAKNTMETAKGIREQIGILKQLNTKLTGAPPLVQYAI